MSINNELRSIKTDAYDKIADNSTVQSKKPEAVRKNVSWSFVDQIKQIPALSRLERLERIIVKNRVPLDSDDQEYINWKVDRILKRHPEISFRAQNLNSTAGSSLQTNTVSQGI